MIYQHSTFDVFLPKVGSPQGNPEGLSKIWLRKDPIDAADPTHCDTYAFHFAGVTNDGAAVFVGDTVAGTLPMKDRPRFTFQARGVRSGGTYDTVNASLTWPITATSDDGLVDRIGAIHIQGGKIRTERTLSDTHRLQALVAYAQLQYAFAENISTGRPVV